MRARAAAVIAALSLIVVLLCARRVLPELAVVVAMTLAFIAGWFGILDGTGEGAPPGQKKIALGAAVVGAAVLFWASMLFLGSLGK